MADGLRNVAEGHASAQIPTNDKTAEEHASAAPQVADELRLEAATTVAQTVLELRTAERCALCAGPQVADELRPEAAATVAALQRMGVEAIMLSGDQRPTALAMAAAVGIPPEVGRWVQGERACTPWVWERGWSVRGRFRASPSYLEEGWEVPGLQCHLVFTRLAVQRWP